MLSLHPLSTILLDNDSEREEYGSYRSVFELRCANPRPRERDEQDIERRDDHPEKNTARIQREGGLESGVTRKRVIRQREDRETNINERMKPKARKI